MVNTFLHESFGSYFIVNWRNCSPNKDSGYRCFVYLLSAQWENQPEHRNGEYYYIRSCYGYKYSNKKRYTDRLWKLWNVTLEVMDVIFTRSIRQYFIMLLAAIPVRVQTVKILCWTFEFTHNLKIETTKILTITGISNINSDTQKPCLRRRTDKTYTNYNKRRYTHI